MTESTIIIINGATGVGKTTIAQQLKIYYNVDSLSTDNVRTELRNEMTKLEFPFLFKSTYEIEKYDLNSANDPLIDNYQLQSLFILNYIKDKKLLVNNTLRIIEGVHLNREIIKMIPNSSYYVFIIVMPTYQDHKLRITYRMSELPNSIHSLKYFDNIRQIGAFIENQWLLESKKNRNIFFVNTFQSIIEILNKNSGFESLIIKKSNDKNGQ